MGVDFDQPFIATVKLIAFQALFAITAFYNLDIEQIDIKIAFFYSIIDQLFYVEVLKKYEQQ